MAVGGVGWLNPEANAQIRSRFWREKMEKKEKKLEKSGKNAKMREKEQGKGWWELIRVLRMWIRRFTEPSLIFQAFRKVIRI
jgi:hypothetical protein